MNLPKKISLLVILVLILFFSFGMATMNIDNKGDMSNCPFMNSGAICQMSFSEHIATFQSIFRAIPSRIVLSLMLALAFLLVLCSKPISRIYSPPIKLEYFIKYDFQLSIYNKILLALSDGIIQPKIYA